jgi:Tol biopolymer transport system component
MAIQDRNSGNIDVWVVDIARGTRTRMTFDPGVDSQPVWSPDGRSIVFRSNRKGHLDLYRKSVDSVDPEELLYADEMDKTPSSWSPDGQTLLYQATTRNGSLDVFTLPMTGRANDQRKPTAFLSAPYNERGASFSPDGRWVLYDSNESSTYEVYVTPFAAQSRPIGKRQVSMTGTTGLAMAARWSADGREIFYVTGDGRMMATEVTATTSTFAAGTTRLMFPVLADVAPAFDVSADGQRFLVEAPRDQSTVPPITLVQNWLSALAGK